MKWYYIFSRDWCPVVLDYYKASENESYEKGEAHLKQHDLLDKVDYDVMGPFNTRKEAMEDALAIGKEAFKA